MGMLAVSSASALTPTSAGPAGPAETPLAVSQPELVDAVSAGNRSIHFVATNSAAGFTPFQAPFLAAADNAGNFFVSDVSANIVGMFDGQAGSVRSFGVAGAGSSALGSFNGPEGIAVVGNSIFIADFANSRVQQFNVSTGAYISQFGSSGSGDGQFGNPTGLAYNPVNNLLYVCDVNAPGGVHRVQAFDLNGIFQFAFGSAGSGNGQLGIAYALAVDRAGNIYVADSGNSRIDKFNKDGVWIRNIASGISALSVTVDPAANTLWLPAGGGHVYNYDVVGNLLGSYAGAGGPGVNGFLTQPQGIAVTTPISGAARIVVTDISAKLVSLFEHSTQPLVHPGFDKIAITEGGVGGGAIQVAHDQSENVYVTASNLNLVYKYDKFGNFQTFWGTAGAGALNFPRGIALNSAGHVYVVDDNHSRVAIYDANGVYLSSIGSNGTGSGQFQGMAGIAIDKFDYIYVADPVLNRVQEFTPAGTFYAAWGSTGTGPGQFSTATGVAVDSNRATVYTVDYVGARLQEYNWFGTFIGVVASSTSGPGQLVNPFAVAADNHGNVYVADRGTNTIVQFSDAGAYLGSIPFPGTEDANAVDVDPHSGQIRVGFFDSVQRFGATLGKQAGLGYYRPSTHTFVLSRSIAATLTPDITATVAHAQQTDIPLIGDWNGDGIDTPALYRPSTSTFYFWDRWVKLDVAAPDYTFTFSGISATDLPLAGDWNASGSSGLSIYQVAAHQFNLKNTISGSGSDYQVIFGIAGDLPVVGDWDGDGVTTPGVFRPSDASFHISNRNITGMVSDEGSFPLGRISDLPFTGDWQSNGFSGLGVFRRGTGHFFLKYTLDSAPADVDATFDPGKIFGDSFDATGDYPLAGYWGYPSE